jgi:hypothetical protein
MITITNLAFSDSMLYSWEELGYDRLCQKQ